MEKTFENDNFGINRNNARSIPSLVVSRAKSAGTVGEAWLTNLDGTISELEHIWNISVGEALSGGTHAFVAYADGQNGEQYVLKIDMPESLGGEFQRSIAALKMVDGHGYAKLYAYDPERKACLLERLGKPINQMGYSVFEQLRIICAALQKTWEIPATNTGFPSGEESIAWFREFIGETWEKLNRPCSHKVIKQAFTYLQSREEAMEPSEYVLLHGDAHGGNTLKELSSEGFKLIDPDGIFYEKAYDLGVLMREWVDEYEQEPLKKGKERCWYLHTLTGVSEKAIWEWGYLQTISTAFVLLQIGQAETGRKMLSVAECWTAESEDTKLEYKDKLIRFLSCEYGFQVTAIHPAKRGFYGETWDIHAESGRYFLKIDYWNHHKESYQNSLSVVQYMTDSGISFVPKIIKTKSGHLYSNFCQGTSVAFEYVPGELCENCPTEQLYRCLAEIYRLKADGIEMETEAFGTEQMDTFYRLKNLPELSADVKKVLAEKEPVIAGYAERLKAFAAVCKDDKENFHITHGDAGGNCILNEKRLFLVDWDSVMLAPIERDAWIFICDKKQLETVNLILAENEVDYRLKQNRLCYYCYQFFFYYLNEYMKSIVSAENEERKAKNSKDLIAYLDDSWIYKRLEAADKIVCLRQDRQ